MKPRLVPPALLATVVALAIAGCGGGGGDNGGGEDPASLAPPKTPLFVDFTIRPEGETKTDIEALAKNVAGIDDLGDLVVSELEQSTAEEGEKIDFEAEIEPWLGERAGLLYPKLEEGEFRNFAVAIQVTDSEAAEEFVVKRAEENEERFQREIDHGVIYYVDLEDRTAVGVAGNFLVISENDLAMVEMLGAADGKSLADESTYADAVSEVPDDSAADVYVDIGGLIHEAEGEGEVDQSAKAFFENTGIELDEATAVASAIPGSDQLEIDLSSNVTGDNPPSGDASELLGSLPKTAVGALASAEFGKRFSEGIDQIDENGIEGEVPPHQLKKAMKEAGIDLKAIASSIGDAGLFLTGNSRSSLGGALVLTAEDASSAKNTVSNIGLFLRASGMPGVTAIDGKASGFSIRSSELGGQPVVVLAKGDRIAIGYGRVPALAALQEGGETLSESSAYQEAVSALGSTPISAFVDGPAALRLASALVPPGEEGFREAKRYLSKIEYLAVGSEASGDLAKAKLIVGVGK